MEKVKFVEVKDEKPLLNKGFYVQFNPEKMSISDNGISTKSSSFRSDDEGVKDVGGNTNTQPLQNHKSPVTLTMTLLFNSLTSFEEKNYTDVRQAIQQFQAFINVMEDKVKSIGVIYGAMSIVGFITSLSTTYTAFDTQGKALRAEVNITVEGKHFGEIKKMESENQRVVYKDNVSFAQSLKAYGNASAWKTTAKSTKLEDPFLI